MNTKKTLSLIFFIFGITQTHAQVLWGENNSRTDTRDNAGLLGTSGAVSGFYHTSNPVNYPSQIQPPAGNSNWIHLLDIRHSNPGNNYAMQFAGGFFDQQLYFRKTADNAARERSRILIEIDGKSGIGTLTPRAVFDVAKPLSVGEVGSVFARLSEGDNVGAGTYLGIKGYTTSGSDINNIKSFALEHSFYGITNSSINFLRGGGTTGGAMTFNTNNNSEKMRIFSNGSVAIGTTNAKGYKLAVAGSVDSESITVNLQGSWPDYVFDNDYSLASLQDIAAYILKNKHLPDMPSAIDVGVNGQNLGEINSSLLKNIEILTLHLIEKDKQLKTQEGRLQLLEQKTKKLEENLIHILQLVKK